MMRLFLLLSSILLITGTAYSQQVTGKIVDETDTPVPYANIVWLTLPDSAFVAGTVSNEDGTFALDIQEKEGTIRISSIGYATASYPIDENRRDMGIIRLASDIQMLGEVTVKADIPVTHLKGDALVTNIENSILSQVGSANDVLSKIPGIVKKQDAFEVFGKGKPLIYINGRQLRDLSELEQLNSDEIKQIEVIRNPGSRYDATVKAVVRIQTIRKQGEGFGIDLRSSYYQSKNVDLIEQAHINYRHDNLDLFGAFGYNRIENLQDAHILQSLQSKNRWNYENQATFKGKSEVFRGDVGINYQINERHSIGAKYTLDGGSGKNRNESENRATRDGDFYDLLKSVSDVNTDPDLTHQLNAYYNGQVEKLNIDFNADYYQSGYDSQTSSREISSQTENRDIHTASIVKNRLGAGKLIFSFPLGGGSLAFGSEVTYTHREDNYINREGYTPTSYSKIEEINAAGFAEYNRSFPWGDWSAGLRYEHVDFDYYKDHRRVDEQSRTFDNFFPNISFSTKLGPVRTQLSYTAKTVRPNYRQLSNNIMYTDRYTMQTGDPTLRPTIIHDLTWSGTWRFLQLSMSYTQRKHWIFYWGETMEGYDSQVLLRYLNWEKSIPAFDAMLSASPTIGCWSPILSVGVMKQWLTIESDGAPYRMNSPTYMASFNNYWKLPYDFTLGLDMNIQSKGAYQNSYVAKAYGSVDISLRKSFLKDALSIELRGTDLFDTNQDALILRSGYFTVDQQNRFDRREFSVTVRYKFNTAKSKYKGTGAGNKQIKRM